MFGGDLHPRPASSKCAFGTWLDIGLQAAAEHFHTPMVYVPASLETVVIKFKCKEILTP